MSEFRIPNKLQIYGQDIEHHQLVYHQKRVAVTKEFTFDAAHHLHAYDGKCTNLHGHTYRVIMTVSGQVNDIGLVVDFGDLKAIFKERIEKRLDHQYLNEVLPLMNTSAENMVVWMWEELKAGLDEMDLDEQSVRLEELTLYETPTSRATVKREWMEE